MQLSDVRGHLLTLVRKQSANEPERIGQRRVGGLVHQVEAMPKRHDGPGHRRVLRVHGLRPAQGPFGRVLPEVDARPDPVVGIPARLQVHLAGQHGLGDLTGASVEGVDGEGIVRVGHGDQTGTT